MTAINATLENGQNSRRKPLTKIAVRLQALVLMNDADPSPQGFPAQKLAEEPLNAEKEFEAIGLRDFFREPVDEGINWEKFFKESADGETDWEGFFKDQISLDLQMPSFIPGDETERAEELF